MDCFLSVEMFTLLVKFPVAVAMDSRGSPFPNSVDSPGDIFVTHLSKTVHENLTKINKNMHRINRYVG